MCDQCVERHTRANLNPLASLASLEHRLAAQLSLSDADAAAAAAAADSLASSNGFFDLLNVRPLVLLVLIIFTYSYLRFSSVCNSTVIVDSSRRVQKEFFPNKKLYPKWCAYRTM